MPLPPGQSLIHSSEAEILAGEVTLKLGEGGLHESLQLQPLLLGDARAQAKSLDATVHADHDELDGHVIVDVAASLLTPFLTLSLIHI